MNPGHATGNAAGIRFLIVDDCPDAGKILGLLLQRAGYQVEITVDSTQCLPLLESFKPDVLLLDIAMPTISGYSLAKQIRARPEFDMLIIIAVTGYADPQHTQWSLDAGCDRHLPKPVDIATLKLTIAGVVEKRLRLGLHTD
jgi:CheY-like chemotaxis protein